MERNLYKQIKIAIIILMIGFTTTLNASPIANNNDTPILSENQKWVKLGVAEDGIYKITSSDLSNIGINIEKTLVSTIKIYGTGGDIIDENPSAASQYLLIEQNITVIKNADGSLKDIFFFGSGPQGIHYNGRNGFEHYNNCYAEKNSYILTFGGDEAKTPEYFEAPTGNPEITPNTYSHIIFREKDIISPYPVASGREWFDNAAFATPFTNQFYNLDVSGEVIYKVRVAHTAKSGANFYFNENGISLGSTYLSDSGSEYTDAVLKTFYSKIPASQIAADGRSKLNIEYKTKGGEMGISYLDYLEIEYPRSFVAIDNELSFCIDSNEIETGKIAQFTANGFSGDLKAYEISDRLHPKILNNISSTGGIYKFKNQLDKENYYAQFYISGKTKSPTLEIAEFGNLTAEKTGADIIVIYPKEFEEAAQKYSEFRNTQGKFSAIATNIDYIYNEFGTGKKDIAAIRNYISYAYHNWEHRPRFVLLMGDGHNDYRNIGTKVKNYVPAYEMPIDSDALNTNANSYSTPDFFVAVAGKPYDVNLAIGRLPVNSAAEAILVVDKIINYENNPNYGLWNTRALMLADDQWKEGSADADYVNSSETIRKESFPEYVQTKRLYSPAFPTYNIDGKERRKPLLEEAMLSEINTTGAAIVNYVGHGNPRVWSHEEWLDRERTIPQMINYNKLFLCYAATCEYGRFETPNVFSGAELMVTSKVGGAIGVIAATRAVINGPNVNLGIRLYEHLFSIDTTTGAYTTIGEALYKSKIGYNEYNTQKFVLLGDPAVSLNIPTQNVELTSLCGVDMTASDTIITIKALEKVKMSGQISDATGKILTDFNGTGFLTLYDGDEDVNIVDDMGFDFNYTDYGGTLNKSPFAVKNGVFTTEIIIPKDISYSEQQGKIFLYAFDTTSTKTAQGVYDNIIINGIESSAPEDNAGPEIAICLDYKEFKEGDYVSAAPLLMINLFDESGINTTGMGIGHKIEAWVDENANSIELTDKYQSSIDDMRRGTIEELLNGLEPGLHKVKIRAWDVYNNFSVKETYFRIKGANESAEITEIQSYPNPTPGPATITFSHTAQPPYDVDITIFSSNGMQVRQIATTLPTLRYASIDWNGKDEHGNDLAQGAYYYLIQINEAGKISNSSGSLLIQK